MSSAASQMDELWPLASQTPLDCAERSSTFYRHRTTLQQIIKWKSLYVERQALMPENGNIIGSMEDHLCLMFIIGEN